MRKSSRRLVIKSAKLLLAALALAAVDAPWCRADVEPNQILSFKKIHIEPVHDNVDGAFQAPVEQSYREIFDRNQRFELVSDKAAADTLLRTRLEKKATGTDLEITLIVTGSGEVFSTDRSVIPAAASGRETGAAVKALLKTALKRIPFYGTVTGRDGNELTFDIGAAHGLKKGDVIQLARIDQIKRHPLLKSIVDAQLVPVGTAVVDETEETIAFGHVNDEIAGEKIQKLHKVTAIEARLPDPVKARPAEDLAMGTSPAPVSRGLIEEIDESDGDRPQIGFVGLGTFLGAFSSSSSRNAGATNFSGSAFNPGFRLTTEIWLTKRWFGELSFGASTMSYAQTNTAITTAATPTGITSSTRNFGIGFGYKHLIGGALHGPQAFVKLGYHSFTWDTSVSASDLLSPKTYSGLNLGVGGLLPLGNQKQGVMLGINVLLFPGMVEEPAQLGTDPSASGASFFLGGYVHLSPRLALRGGFLLDVYSADFGTGSTQSSTTQKAIGFLPSILYYF